jgi:hypothetical protein
VEPALRNYDFFFLTGDAETWYHANHQQDVTKPKDPMMVYKKTNDEFEALWNQYQNKENPRFNEFMFCAVYQAQWT